MVTVPLLERTLDSEFLPGHQKPSEVYVRVVCHGWFGVQVTEGVGVTECVCVAQHILCQGCNINLAKH
jgi:hypothetical protein